MKPIRKAVMPVAGLGTRVLPATKAMPKELLPVVDKPLIQYAVEEARAAGIEEIIFVTARGKTVLEDHFDYAPELEHQLRQRGKTHELELLHATMPDAGRIITVRQGLPLGLGHAVWSAKVVIGNEPFAVLLPDDLIQANTPCLQQMLEVYRETGGNVVSVMEVPREQTRRYGVLDVAEDRGRIVTARGFVEKPAPEEAPSNLCVIGRYILQPAVLDELERREVGSGGEIQLTDAIAATLGRVPLHGYRFKGQRYDCGSKAGYVEAILAMALEHPELGERMRHVVQRLAQDYATTMAKTGS